MFKLTCPVNQSIGINKKNIKELSSKYQSRSIYQQLLKSTLTILLLYKNVVTYCLTNDCVKKNKVFLI